jgi:hypothetical protein
MAATQQPRPDLSQAIVCCRPGWAGWLGIVLLTILGGAFLALGWKSSMDPTALFFEVLFLVPVPLWAVYQLHACIVADDTRLYWRGLKDWESVQWEDISDYYIKRLAKGQLALKIITPHKDLMFSEGGAWTNLAALRVAIQQNATHAFAKTWEKR